MVKTSSQVHSVNVGFISSEHRRFQDNLGGDMLRIASEKFANLDEILPDAVASTGKRDPNWWRELGNSVTATNNIDDVAADWRALEKNGIESPGQSLDFTRAWIENFGIEETDQLYVTGSANGKVVALLPLVRRKRYGIEILTWFAGPHVGCNSPLIDKAALAEMSNDEVSKLWKNMFGAMFGADAVVLHSMPVFPERDLFENVGDSIPWDTLYRSEFESWEACVAKQHSRSRRKHDRQQGAKLGAMGEVTFEQVSGCDFNQEHMDAIDLLFSQKAKRFADWGVDNPFEHPTIHEFYKRVYQSKGMLEGKLHILRLDGKIVSLRYNLVHGDRVFALISSMDDRPELQPGSPGKQNLLRGMTEIFTSGTKICDMGAGYSDEKRAWCNVEVPLRTHYVPLNTKGKLGIKGHQLKGYLKREIKGNPKLFSLLKGVRAARNLGRSD